MIRLATVIHTFATGLRTEYGNQLSSAHLQALAAMRRCRTQASAKMHVQCTGCAHQTLVPHSCGHRHCPHCQHHESQQWLERQLKRLVPAEYFLVTFTLPVQLRPLAWTHQGLIYDLLLRCGWDTLHTFSRNDRQLQGTPGAIAVLHTSTRRLDYHPHAHFVVPAAALDAERKRWRTKRRKKGGGGTGAGASSGTGSYLFNQKALAKVFRAKMLAGIEAAGLTLPCGTPKEWVADCKPVGSGTSALVYLGRYLYRGVIQEKDIVACKDGQVTFRYRDAKTGKSEHRTVPGAQFLWLVLQHVLPKGFRRARNFGFLHPNCKRLIALLQVLLRFVPIRAADWVKPRPQFLCACCGAVMKIVRTRITASFAGSLPIPLAVQGAN